jgi:nitrous oxidase accessory protein
MGKSAAATLVLVFLAASCLTVTFSVNADPRTIVVPDDFRTIASAIAYAANGDTVYVKSGKYAETSLVINKSIALIGENVESTTINLDSPRHEGLNFLYQKVHWYETAMTVASNGFKLSGFRITTTGGDISIIGNKSKITGNSISAELSIKGSYVDVLENVFTRKTVNGISVAGDWCNISANQVNHKLSVSGKNNIVSFNNITGSLYVEADDSFIYKNNLYSEQWGEFGVIGHNSIVSKNTADHLHFGLAVTGSNNKALLNQITNCQMGISPTAGNTYYANYIANTTWPINPLNKIMNPAGNASVLIHNNFVNNQIYRVTSMVMPNTIDYFDNGKEGNYWSAYKGTDEDGDGVGDTPFYLDSTHLDRYPLMAPFNLSSVAELIPDWLSMPSVQLISPKNTTYSIANVTIVFIIDKQVSWLGYSLDGQDNVTISENTTITDLPNGLHNITVYAKDTYGNMGASETVSFTVEVPFPTTVAIAFTAVASAIGVSLAGYLIKTRRKNQKNKNVSPTESSTTNRNNQMVKR